MLNVNKAYKNAADNYLFSEIAKRVNAYSAAHPGKRIIRLGIGDVTCPIAPAVISAMHKAVDEEGVKETFISDGAKCDAGNIQELFSQDTGVALCDPVYPVYADSNLIAGRKITYMDCTEENGFLPDIGSAGDEAQLIYLCFPNNPTGTVISGDELQGWVDHALRTGSVIIYDAAYESYISDKDIPHSIYECEGAKGCAIEIRSFSKSAGFTGLRLGYTVVPKELKRGGMSLHSMWLRRHSTKYNGAPYIIQRAGEAVYSAEGSAQTKEQVSGYMRNANYIAGKLRNAGFTLTGGVNAPYIWLRTPDGMSSWAFFDRLLEEIQVVGTPGSGFGRCGEGYFRLTAFGDHENTKEAVSRIISLI